MKNVSIFQIVMADRRAQAPPPSPTSCVPDRAMTMVSIVVFRPRFWHSCLIAGLPGSIEYALLVNYWTEWAPQPIAIIVPATTIVFIPIYFTFSLSSYNTEKLDFANFKLTRKQEAEICKKQVQISRKNSEIIDMRSKLHAAEELTAKVMSDAEATLSPYAIKHALIDFGPAKVMLGEGSFGTVFVAWYLKQEVAVKTMRVSKVTEKELSRFKEELIVSAVYRARFHIFSPRTLAYLGRCFQIRCP